MTEKPSTKGIPAWYHMKYCHMLETAREAGYALAIHGSLQRDLDLIAMPWTSEAMTAEALIEKFVTENGLIKIEPQGKERPHGRKSYSLGMGGDLYADISVMPLSAPAPLSSEAVTEELENLRLMWQSLGHSCQDGHREIHYGGDDTTCPLCAVTRPPSPQGAASQGNLKKRIERFEEQMDGLEYGDGTSANEDLFDICRAAEASLNTQSPQGAVEMAELLENMMVQAVDSFRIYGSVNYQHMIKQALKELTK